MPAAQSPALWLSAAATAVCAVTVAAMAASDGPRRPLTFAGAVLLPGSQPSGPSPAEGVTTQPGKPSASPSRPRTSAPPPAASSANPSAAASTGGYSPSMPAVIPVQHNPAGTPTQAAPASSSPPAAIAGPASRPSGQSQTPQTPRTGEPTEPGAGTSATALAQALFTALNDARQRAGLPTLSWSAGLGRSAAGHNRQMASANELAFRIGDEPALGVRQANQGVLGSYAAENVGSAQATDVAGALAAQQQMLTEQPPDDRRRQNLLSPLLNSVGIDVLLDPAHGRMWITQDFARLDG